MLTSRTKLLFHGKHARNRSKGYISFIRHGREWANVNTFTEGTRQAFKQCQHIYSDKGAGVVRIESTVHRPASKRSGSEFVPITSPPLEMIIASYGQGKLKLINVAQNNNNKKWLDLNFKPIKY